MTAPIPPAELERYADVIVQVGLNIQPGQRLIIRADLTTADLVRAVARRAYQAGARLIDVTWSDEQLALIRVQTAPRDSLSEAAAWIPRVSVEYMRAGDVRLAITSETPTLMVNQDPEAVSTMKRAEARAAQELFALLQRNASVWTVVAYPSPGWAAHVFPGLPADEQVSGLWRAIATICRLHAADPVATWWAHIADLEARSAYLTERAYSALHFRAPGTDLRVGLAPGHSWAGGGSVSERGQRFVPNLPTEEVFTLPHRERVEGTVRSSRPLIYGGNVIDEFTLTFEGGRVVRATAAQGEEVLRRLLATDEGAARLGEVALAPGSSPVGQTGLLFANTLYDENASSHLALGGGYRFCLAGGSSMSAEEFAAAGGNLSAIHEDFMIGSPAMDVDGLTATGSAEPVMRGGEWAFRV
ncbi:MAG: aminopeptidase [Chloroflexaceae bacterium]